MTPEAPRLAPPIGKRDHIRGPLDAPTTLLEFGDYECPFCGAASAIVDEVRRRMGHRSRFAFRHFPLMNLHPHALRAAEAAEAAGAQRRFWLMHDRLYEHQEALEDRDLVAHAEAIGLDVARFARDLDAGVYLPRIQADMASGLHSGVQGTPTFFINGVKHEGAYDVDALIFAIESARKAA
jgi:protein-disulfide isomerase